MRLKADLILLLTAAIWGSAFAAQRVAAPYVGPFLFNGSRFLLAALVLLPLVRLRLKLDRRSLPWVVGAGMLLYAASALQQAGLRHTTAANAGFLTSLYVLLVPLIMAVAFRHKITWLSWTAALMAVAGSYLLSTAGSLKLAPGDGLEIIGAAIWALHVIVVGQAVQRLEVMSFAIGQCLVSGSLEFAHRPGV